MDPVVGLERLSDEDLAALADALFRHLDAGEPEFGAQSWYDSVREEIAARRAGAELAEVITPEPDLAG
ncbi:MULTISPECIES: hypothetical protein [Arthrobacter]|nr:MULTISPECIES: hypothetical protein [Arthrobacter]